MEKTNVSYIHWPEWIKILTARYVKKVIPKDPKVVRSLSMLNLVVGVGILIMGYFTHNDSNAISSFGGDLVLIFLGILNLVLGLWNFFVTYNLYVWVTENSSWEERFAHKSSGKHQLLYFLFFALIFAGSYGLTLLF